MTMRDENHLNELLAGLQGAIKRLRSDHSPEYADDVDEAATQLRVLFDEVEDLAASVAELSEALRQTELDREDLREELYYVQDQRDDERAERALQEERADELQLRLDEARVIEADLRSEIVSMQETIDMQQEDL